MKKDENKKMINLFEQLNLSPEMREKSAIVYGEDGNAKHILLGDGRCVTPYVSVFRRKERPKFGIFCMGGLPHIASLRFEVSREGAWGYDLADIAFIKDNRPKWGKDADLISDKDRKIVEDLCANYKD